MWSKTQDSAWNFSGWNFSAGSQETSAEMPMVREYSPLTGENVTTSNQVLFVMIRIAKVLAVIATILSIGAIVITGKTQLLLFTGFAVSCAFYSEEILQKREIKIVRAEPIRTLVSAG